MRAAALLLSSLILTGCHTGAPTTLSRAHFPMTKGTVWVYDSAGKEVRFSVTGTTDVEGGTAFKIQRTGKKPDVAYTMSVRDDGARIHSAFGRPYRPGYIQFAFGTRAGDTWTWQGTIGGNPMAYVCENKGVETVTVPAGTFRAVRIVETLNGKKVSTNDMWLAPDVGVVRVVGKQWIAPAESYDTYDWKLKRYQN